MKFSRILSMALIGSVALAACTQQVAPKPIQPNKVTALGKIEVAFGDSSALRTQAVLPDNAITFTRTASSVDTTGTERYIRAVFDITNNTASAFNNLTFYAYNQSANSIGGTAIKSLNNFGNVNVASTAAAQSLKPTHGLDTSGASVSGAEDLQVFQPTEASDAQAAGLAAIPPVLGNTDTVLEYGFVARRCTANCASPNPTWTRTIGAGETGQISLAYKLPEGILSNSANPYGFVATFVLANETTARVSRSPEEPTSSASSRATAFTATQTILVGADADTATGSLRLSNAKIGTAPTTLLDPICSNGATLTSISTLQGSGTATTASGTHTIQGVVVGAFQSADSSGLQGFYLQDRVGDSNTATSDAIFVDEFGATPDSSVPVGSFVRVTGAVSEFSNLTRIVPTTVTRCGTQDLPSPVQISFPLTGGQTDLEKFEGMLSQIPTQMTVTELFELGRFGQVEISSSGTDNQVGTDDRLDQFTQFNLPSVAGNASHLAALNKRKIVVDDARSDDNGPANILGRGGNPLTASNTLRGGDTITNLTGILDERFAAYRIQPTTAANFQAVNARTSSPTVAGSLRVASFNVLNYFTTLNTATTDTFTPTGCSAIAPRGANTATEFTRQKDKTIAAIRAMNADVLGLIEMQNNGADASSAIVDLVTAVNAGQPLSNQYAVIADPAAPERSGCDAIKVAFIYKPSTVTPVATGLSTATVGAVTVASGAAFTVPAGYDGNTDLVAAFDNNNRKPIAVTFQQISSSETFTAVMNHFKSKGSSAGGVGDTDTNDGQGNSNGTRVRASKDLKSWLATNPTGTTDTDYLIMGDLNAYAKENPITELETVFTNLLPLSTYSYAFDGAWGSLDHALGSTSLTTQLAGAAKWHINADEPTSLDYNTQLDPSGNAATNNKIIKTPAQTTSLYAADAFRSSDHDPVVVGLNLGSGFSVSASALSNNNYTVGAAGTATSTITVNRTSFTDPVTLSLEVSPANAGITGSFSNNPNSSGTSTLNLSVDNTVTAGTYTLTVKGTFGAMVMSSSTFNIIVAPVCTSLSVTPNSASIAVGATQQLTTTFSPSGCAATAVTWSNGGSAFATVNTSGLVLGALVGSGTIITATAGAINGTSTINVTASVSVAGLVINEVDYDNIGTDSVEYIEIYNPTASAISLSGIKVFLVNGSNNTSYTTIDLTSGGSLAANSYLVIANTAFLSTITASVEIAFAGTNDQIQNGSPDGIALVNTNTSTLVDALSYEGSITAAVLTGIGTFNLVEGTVLAAATADSNTVVGAFIRSPNGTDANNASTDWVFTATLSPGTAN